MELPDKTHKVMDFAWEPKGTRFALLHGEGNRPSLSLYDMGSGSARVRSSSHALFPALSDQDWSA